MKKQLSILFALAVCPAFVGSSQAATIFYNSQAAYLAAISNPGTDTFDDMPGTLVGSPINRSAGAYTYTASVPNGFFPAGTAGDRWLSDNTASETIIFDNFSAGVRGFGAFFFGTDFNGAFLAGKSITIVATDGSGSTSTTLTNTTVGTFLGIVSDQAFTSIAVSAVQDGVVWPTLNDLTLGAAASQAPEVPEPGTWATVCLSLAGLGFAARRRKANHQ